MKRERYPFFSYLDTRDRCNYRECKSKPVYILEWLGLNQRGEDPLVVSEIYACENMQHILYLCREESEYEPEPEGVSLISTEEEDLGMLERILNELDPSRNQRLLFPELVLL